MPADNGVAFVVVLHLSPNHESVIDRILASSTKMPVQQVTGRCEIKPNHVFVLSPARQLAMNDGYLQANAATRPQGTHVAICSFETWRTLTNTALFAWCNREPVPTNQRARRPDACAKPGGCGIRWHATGCNRTQLVYLILPSAEMPQKLLDLWRNAQTIHRFYTRCPHLPLRLRLPSPSPSPSPAPAPAPAPAPV